MGRTTTYLTEFLADEAQRLTITHPDGTTSQVTAHQDGRRESVSADGTTTTLVVTGDPEFGLQAPVALQATVATPGGLTTTVQTERYATFATPGNYATLERSEYVTVNNRTYETLFDGATRTFTTTTPAGRVTTSTVDPQGRVTSTQIGNLTPVLFTYDAQGRLSSTTQGARTSSISYDTSGRPSVLTDALTRTVSFGYDVADRVTTQTLPNAQVIGFAYDGNSNVTALTPPSRPAHTFTYTPVNLTSSYIPPTVSGTGATGYLFNVDRQPTEIQRPDGHTTTFTYSEPSGRLTSVGFSRNNTAATLQYGYDTAGRVSTLTDSGGVNLAFTYDGSMPLSETWSGGLTGSVSRTFTHTFELNSESVNGANPVTFGYDEDRLLTSAGALTITRDATNGLVTGTTLGSTTEAHQYNPFGEPTRQTSSHGSTQLFDVQTTRDNLGRITQRIETFPEITRTFHYGYDLAGRLQTVTRDGVSGQVTVAAYTYDGNGNRAKPHVAASRFSGRIASLAAFGPTASIKQAYGVAARASLTWARSALTVNGFDKSRVLL
jgi:YD repeat-containing protein